MAWANFHIGHDMVEFNDEYYNLYDVNISVDHSPTPFEYKFHTLQNPPNTDESLVYSARDAYSWTQGAFSSTDANNWTAIMRHIGYVDPDGKSFHYPNEIIFYDLVPSIDMTFDDNIRYMELENCPYEITVNFRPEDAFSILPTSWDEDKNKWLSPGLVVTRPNFLQRQSVFWYRLWKSGFRFISSPDATFNIVLIYLDEDLQDIDMNAAVINGVTIRKYGNILRCFKNAGTTLNIYINVNNKTVYNCTLNPVPSKIKTSSWHDIKELYVKVDNVWRKGKNSYIKTNNTWEGAMI